MKKNIHKILGFALVVSLGWSSCSKMIEAPESGGGGLTPTAPAEAETSAQYDFRSAIPGRLIVKFSTEALRKMQLRNGELRSVGVESAASQAFEKLGVGTVRRFFAPSEQFAERQKAAGLDRWFEVTFPEGTPIAFAHSLLSGVNDFEIVEPFYELSKPSVSTHPLSAEELNALVAKVDDKLPANDPLLAKQWHYHNDGSLSPEARRGSDINLFEAWAITTGRQGVTVAVVDGGVDSTHTEFAHSLDLEHSYNFIVDRRTQKEHGKGNIYPDTDGHGTHVAGTIAAATNNGVGVSGIAGGDGTEGSGVRIVSLQVYGRGTESADGAKAIAWAADNTSAVISQNSWGYTHPGPKNLPAYDKEAIDYFIKYAGCDKDGKQLPESPMKGGVVIFAAGNDGQDYRCWPAAYEPVISVASFAWDHSVALYSNRGDWVDISAPGGDQLRFPTTAGVLSTIPMDKGDRTGYGYMQGTSMACPHVSGVAALIVSQKGKAGYTAEQLTKDLLAAVRPYNINALNPKYSGRLGVGYIDAAAALQHDGGVVPKAVSSCTATASYHEVTVDWAVATDGDAPMGTAFAYDLYLSTKAISDANIGELTPARILGEEKKVGETLTHRYSALDDATKYYVAVVAVDRFGHRSAPAFATVETKPNAAPEITAGYPPEPMQIQTNSKRQFSLSVSEADGHAWSFTATKPKGVSVVRQGDKFNVEILPLLPPGAYNIELNLTDEYGKSQAYKIEYHIVKYIRPIFAEDFKAIALGLNEDVTVPIETVLSYTEGSKVSVSVSSASEATASAKVEDGKLVLKGQSEGRTTLHVTASDGQHSVATTIEVAVLKEVSGIVKMLYPMPVKSHLNMLFTSGISRATVTIGSVRGERLLKQDVRVSSLGFAKVNTSSLATGLYTIHVSTSRGSYKGSFVKQ